MRQLFPLKLSFICCVFLFSSTAALQADSEYYGDYNNYASEEMSYADDTSINGEENCEVVQGGSTPIANCEDSKYDDCDTCNDGCCNGSGGVWMPEAPPLVRPFLADPRKIVSSVGMRWGDRVLKHHAVADVSYADDVPVYRWCQMNFLPGKMQLDIEGALWAVFEPLEESAPLVNADYHIGFLLTYEMNNTWSFRLRGYHISSHIGDEFLLEQLPEFERKNPSAEYLEFHAVYHWNYARLYAGVGQILESDTSFECKGPYFEAGIEAYLPCLTFIACEDRIEGRPFVGADFQSWRDNNYQLNSTFVAGYEFGKLCGLKRRFRVFVEYHSGFSVEGQFCRARTSYTSLRATYGF
jgi:hypothetical protein